MAIPHHPFSVLTLTIVIVASLIIFYFVFNAAPFKVCAAVEAKELEPYQKTIAALDGVVDLSIKLATTLVGLGAAILIGLKSGVRLNSVARLFILLASVCFVQSALYAVWWRMGVAELWLNECLGLIVEPRLAMRYEIHFYFFMAGLFLMGLIVGGAAYGQAKSEGDYT